MKSDYEKGRKVGAGTFGVVYRATKKGTNEVVALKKIRLGQNRESEGVQFTALREMRVLQELNHENVLKLFDVFVTKHSNVVLVLEFLHSDLEVVVKDRTLVLSLADVKSYMQMILRGVSYLHDTQWLLHRDLKPSNVLIANDGVVKLADFGFARNFGSPNASLTPLVVTRWYRCPELLFNATQYTGAIDIWSVGCIFAELMLRTPLFPAETDIEQLRLIFRLRGTPTEETWPGHTSLPTYIPFKPSQPKEMKQIFVAAGADALDLLDRCLALDPAKRCTAQEALDHDYFSARPVPTHPQELPRPEREDDVFGENDTRLAGPSPGKRRGEFDGDDEGVPASRRRLDEPSEGTSPPKRLEFD